MITKKYTCDRCQAVWDEADHLALGRGAPEAYALVTVGGVTNYVCGDCLRQVGVLPILLFLKSK